MTKKIILFALLILYLAGCNGNEDFANNDLYKEKEIASLPLKPPTVQSKVIKIIVRNASYPIHDPGGNNLSRHYELRERQIDIPLNQTALILIDTWDIDRERFKDSDSIDIAKEIKPLLHMAREVDMLVLYSPHRPIGWDGINHKQRDLDLRGPTDTPRSEIPVWVKQNKINKSQWPPVEFIFRVGEYSKYSRYSNPLYIPYPRILGIHKDLLPIKREREFIASSLNDVQRIFQENKILHLLYVGGATNQCVVQRPVGIRNMSARGFNTIIVRGATIGSELNSTYGSRRVTKAAILDIEINNGFSVDKDDLLNALKSIKTSL